METIFQHLEMADRQRRNLSVIWEIRVLVPMAENGESVNYIKPNETIKN